MKRFRLLTAVLCIVVLLCGFAVPAYAYADGVENDTPTVPEETQPVETASTETVSTIAPGVGFSEDGNLVTRDLLYDKTTNKQFIVVETSGGATFYIVIDYDKPLDEDGDHYHTYFLNMVDEADLLAALEAAGGEIPVCTCTDKCAVGSIHTDCPVCSVNMSECEGVTPEPVPTVEPEPEPEPEPKQNGSSMGGKLLLVLAVIGIGGGAGWYFKIYRPKKEQAADATEDEYEEYDDTPPWEDEDDLESEDSV